MSSNHESYPRKFDNNEPLGSFAEAMRGAKDFGEFRKQMKEEAIGGVFR